MRIERTAQVGTLESSDVQITLAGGSGGLSFDLYSDVAAEYGEQIKAVVAAVLSDYAITDAHVKIVDKGALDCTIKARTIAAVGRTLGTTNEPDWDVIVNA